MWSREKRDWTKAPFGDHLAYGNSRPCPPPACVPSPPLMKSENWWGDRGGWWAWAMELGSDPSSRLQLFSGTPTCTIRRTAIIFHIPQSPIFIYLCMTNRSGIFVVMTHEIKSPRYFRDSVFVVKGCHARPINLTITFLCVCMMYLIPTVHRRHYKAM